MDPATPPDSPSTVVADSVLIDRIRAGDVQTYGVLVERYERSALAAVLPIVRGDRHAAQDVVQETFVQCYLKLADLRDGSRFGGWLIKSARRQAVRAARRLTRSPSPVMRAAASENQSDDRTFNFDEHEHVLHAVRQLPKHERLMISLRFFDGHSVKDIAAMTARPIGTVTKQLSRALQRLRGELTNSENQTCPPSMKQQSHAL